MIPVPTVTRNIPAYHRFALAPAALLALFVTTGALAQTMVDTRRVNLSTIGDQANNNSLDASIARSGDFVVFASDASNLVVGDTGTTRDVFRHDLTTDELREVTLQKNASDQPSVSDDGRFVAFRSSATGFQDSEGNTWNDTNNTTDIYLRDMQSGAFELISRNSSGSAASGTSSQPRISADGRFVAFHSTATDLVSGDTNNSSDIFVYDRQNDTMTRVSVHSDGSQANGDSDSASISADSRFVAFSSSADNLVNNDNNGFRDIFVHDRQRGQTTRVSVDSNGFEANAGSFSPAISADGRFVTFYSTANNLAPGDTAGSLDVFVHDRATGETTSFTVGETAFSDAMDPVISADGSRVAFIAVPRPTPSETFPRQVYWHDHDTGETVLLSSNVNNPTRPGNLPSFFPATSSAGDRVAYDSFASDLVGDDTNAFRDIFLSELSELSEPQPPASPTETSLRNISTNGPVDARGMIAGFIIEESGTFAILAESEGPDPISDAVLTLERMTASGTFTEIAFNDNWNPAQSAQFQAIIGRTPANDTDAALIIDLQPGTYLATITGKNGETGTGIVAVNQQATSDSDRPNLRNISTNGPVDARGMIAGFIIEESGTFAILAESEGPDPISDAVLTLERMTASGTFTEIAFNDNWNPAQSAQFQAIIGRTPANDTDAALIIDLQPGTYLATITGKNGETGTGIVAVNQAQP